MRLVDVGPSHRRPECCLILFFFFLETSCQSSSRSCHRLSSLSTSLNPNQSLSLLNFPLFCVCVWKASNPCAWAKREKNTNRKTKQNNADPRDCECVSACVFSCTRLQTRAHVYKQRISGVKNTRFHSIPKVYMKQWKKCGELRCWMNPSEHLSLLFSKVSMKWRRKQKRHHQPSSRWGGWKTFNLLVRPLHFCRSLKQSSAFLHSPVASLFLGHAKNEAEEGEVQNKRSKKGVIIEHRPNQLTQQN